MSNTSEIIEKIRNLASSDEAHPAVAWRIMLAFFTLSLVSISASAYFVYLWSMEDDHPEVATTTKSTMISTEDIHVVVDMYKEKEATFNELRNGLPYLTSTSSPAAILPGGGEAQVRSVQ